METELKFAVAHEKNGELILSDPLLRDLIVPGTDTSKTMKAIYYDFKDRYLNTEKLTYRVRKENKKTVATLKKGISYKDGLYCRMEWNEIVQNTEPDLSVFTDKEAKQLIEAVLGERDAGDMVCIVNSDFIRRLYVIKHNSAEIEVCMDVGSVTSGDKNADICEMEMELLAGDVEDMLSIGEKIKKKYKLKDEKRSKYARGLALLQDKRN